MGLLKWFLCAAAIVGAFALLGTYVPSMWNGFMVSGVLVRYVYLVAAGIVFCFYKLKA